MNVEFSSIWYAFNVNSVVLMSISMTTSGIESFHIILGYSKPLHVWLWQGLCYDSPNEACHKLNFYQSQENSKTVGPQPDAFSYDDAKTIPIQ